MTIYNIYDFCLFYTETSLIYLFFETWMHFKTCFNKGIVLKVFLLSLCLCLFPLK